MKTIKVLMATLATAAMMASCFDDKGSYNAGFSFWKPQYATTPVYANNVADSLIFFSYGSWAIGNYEMYDNSWVDIPIKTGRGNAVYSLRVEFEQNTTGKSRVAAFRIEDTDHPGEANAAFAYWQYATRGDGTLGSAADVKAITGSDGSKVEISYDKLHRPLSLKMTKDDQTLSQLTLNFNDYDSILTVTDGGLQYTAVYDSDYQPRLLRSSTDTIGYYYQYYNYGAPRNLSEVFNFEHRTNSKAYTVYAYKLGGQSLAPDSLHNADSLRCLRLNTAGDQVLFEKMKLNYSKQDNRHQSVDVNQLLLGIDECNPYLLLSLFRYTRSTSIISTAATDTDVINVSATLNADQSVSTLAVTRRDETVTYTFEY